MKTDVTMFRAVRKEEYPNGTVIEEKAVHGVLYPSFEKTPITSGPRKGETREADVRKEIDDKGVFVLPGGGTSLFDKPDVFGNKYWCRFDIPQGTTCDDSLVLAGPDWNPRYNANHYQIEPRIRMRLDAYTGALDNFARAAVARAYELARKPQPKE
jgi:hypothetical protein